MQASTSSTERTPLVQPTYVFESSLARRYQKRLHHMQCALCVFIISILMVALLVTISYNLAQDGDDTFTTVKPPTSPEAIGNLTMLKMAPGARPDTGPGARPATGPGARPATGPGAKPDFGPGGKPWYGPSPKPGYEAAFGPGARPDTGPGARPATGPGARPATGPGAKPDFGPGGKPWYGPSPKPWYEAAAKPESGPGARPDTGPGARPATGPGARPATGPGAKPDFGPGGKPWYGPSPKPSYETAAKPESGPGARPDTGPGARPATGPGARPATGPGAKPDFGPGGKPWYGPSPKPSFETAAKPSSGPGARPATGPGARPATGPGSKPWYIPDFGGKQTMVEDMPPSLKPMLEKKWPLEGPPPTPWVNPTPPTKAELASAVLQGQAALKERTKLEFKRKPISKTMPAYKAQRASATGADVKPMADQGYAVEVATKALTSGVDITKRTGGSGRGPRINGTLIPEPSYCKLNPPPCPPSRYRTIDGTCNNLAHPLSWGVSKTPFRRVLPADYSDGISAPRVGVNGSALPSARDVSVTVHRASYAHDSTFTVMLAVWGQFVDHDITATALSKGENSSALSCCDPSQIPHPECFPVQLDVEDPFYQDYNLTCMEFVRSAPAPTCHFGPRQQMNQATAFIDGSTVYGFGSGRMTSLRTGVEGRLKMLDVGGRQLLPPSTDPNDSCNTVEMNAKGRYCFESGDDRANENLHLTTMHLIWARQHNRIASMLRTYNPSWDDETVFQESRKIVGAQMQHITYTEFLPNVLGADVMWALNLTVKEEGYSDFYDPDVDPTVANHFSAAAFRFAHTLLPGLIHSTNKATGTIQYMHLHQMLFNPFTLYNDTGSKIAMQSAMESVVHAVDPHVTTELSNHMFENPLAATTPEQNSTAPPKPPGPCGLDLVSLNIQRGRDHGLPSYPRWRELCGLSRPKSFTDLQDIFDESSYSRICKIYNSVEDIDLYTGALAEDPEGRLLGPTLTCLIADQFLRLKVGDRFWYEREDDVGFTMEQLTEIKKTTLAGVICANEVLLDQAQPRVMMAVSPTNPLVDCMELPQPSFRPWALDPLRTNA